MMIEQNRKIFAQQAADYDKQDYWRFDEEFLIEKYFKDKKAKLLVLGCGAGRTLLPLYKKGFDITAIDIVPEMVEKSAAKIKGMNIKILEMDATDLKFEDNSFDYVFFPFHGIDCIYPDIYQCVSEARRVLKPGGAFIFNSHNIFFIKRINFLFSGRYADYQGIKLYRMAWFDSLLGLKKYFEKVKIIYRISLQPWRGSNWKDMVYKILPFFSKSIYFICTQPRKNYDSGKK
ncbi:MAG: class I SAM-dependent methyltransferase [Patescibacteria group bacterium]|nr:class I SAM-dependent methyltransferase [Patescibacteria group bacterium]